MGTFRKAKITPTLLERLGTDETVMDTALPGFGVRRQGDARVYFVRKHANNRRHYLTIGEHGQEGWTEAKARNAALLMIAALRQGRDPAAERAKTRGMPTLAEFAHAFLEQHAGKLKRGTLANYRSLLNTHIAPRDQRGTLKAACLGRLRLDQVTHQEIGALHRSMRKTPRAANHVLAFISSLYSEAQAANLVPGGFNPTRRLKRYPVQSRQRFLTETELARVGEALTEAETDGSDDPHALAAIRLLIFTGCRRDEILDARWTWVDLERGLLNLPDSKTGAKPVLLIRPLSKCSATWRALRATHSSSSASAPANAGSTCARFGFAFASVPASSRTYLRTARSSKSAFMICDIPLPVYLLMGERLSR